METGMEIRLTTEEALIMRDALEGNARNLIQGLATSAGFWYAEELWRHHHLHTRITNQFLGWKD